MFPKAIDLTIKTHLGMRLVCYLDIGPQINGTLKHIHMYTWCRCFLTSVSENPCELQILIQKSSFRSSKSHQIHQGKNTVRSEIAMSILNKIRCFSLTRLRQYVIISLVIKGQTRSFVIIIHQEGGGGGKVMISS